MQAPISDRSHDQPHHHDQPRARCKLISAHPTMTPGAKMNDLVQLVDAALASSVARSGAHLVCRPGCTQCCIGVFPIAHEDAARLRDGLSHLTQSDPARAHRIRSRVAQSITRLDPWFPGGRDPGDRTTYGILSEDLDSLGQDQTILFEEFANDEPCPVLDPATGTCDLYAARPILCRTFGPPMRTQEQNLATCELCYIHASTEEIAACELDPAIPALESASNAAFNAAHNLHGETLIAYALRPIPPLPQKKTPSPQRELCREDGAPE